MARQRFRFDFILDIVSATHELDRTWPRCTTTASSAPSAFPTRSRPRRSCSPPGGGASPGRCRRNARGEEDGGLCAEHDIQAGIEPVGTGQFNDALQCLRRGEVRFRFVLDLSRERAHLR